MHKRRVYSAPHKKFGQCIVYSSKSFGINIQAKWVRFFVCQEKTRGTKSTVLTGEYFLRGKKFAKGTQCDNMEDIKNRRERRLGSQTPFPHIW